jgi:hypothetical protein
MQLLVLEVISEMNDITFLSDLANESGVVVLRDRIYTLEPSDSSKVPYLKIDSLHELVRSERVTTLENLFLEDSLQSSRQEKSTKLSSDLSEVKNKINSMRTQEKEGKITKLVLEFLNSYSKAGCVNVTSNLPETIELGDGDFHEQTLSRSILSTIMEDDALVIHQGKCYYPSRKSANQNDSFLDLGTGRKKLFLSSNLESFDKVYAKRMKSAVEKKVQEYFEHYQKILDSAKKTGGLLYNGIESSTGEVGYHREGDEHYLYVNVPRAFTGRSDKLQKKFRFASCKLGLRLTYESNRLDYDRNLESGMIRILFSKQIQNGEEHGELKLQQGENYNHPAVKNTTRNNFPFVCITHNGWKYPKASDQKSLVAVISNVLRRASGVFSDSPISMDHHGPLKLYSYLDRDYERFKQNEIQE